MNIKYQINQNLTCSRNIARQAEGKNVDPSDAERRLRAAVRYNDRAIALMRQAGDESAVGIVESRNRDLQERIGRVVLTKAQQAEKARRQFIDAVLDDNIVSTNCRKGVHQAFAGISATEFNRIPREVREMLVWGALRTYWAGCDDGRSIEADCWLGKAAS